MPINYPLSLDDGVSLYVVVNNTRTRLSTGITDSTTTIPVLDTTGFPSTGFITILTGKDITLAEAISYTGITSNAFTGATRGADGTTALVHNSGENVDLAMLADHHNVLKDAVIELEHFVGVSGSENFIIATSGTIAQEGIVVPDPSTLKVGAKTLLSPQLGVINQTGQVENTTSFVSVGLGSEIIPGDGVETAVFYKMDLGGSDLDIEPIGRLLFDGLEIGLARRRNLGGPGGNTPGGAVSLLGFTVVTGTGQDSFDFQVAGNTSINFDWNVPTIVTWPLSDKFTRNEDYWFDAVGPGDFIITNAPNTFDNGDANEVMSVTYNLPSDGKYLFFCSVEARDTGTGDGCEIRFAVDGTYRDTEYFQERVGNQNNELGYFTVHSVTLTAGNHTFTVEGASMRGGSTTADFRRPRILVIKEEALGKVSIETRNAFSRNVTSYANTLNHTYTPEQDEDVLLIFTSTISSESGVSDVTAPIRFFNVTTGEYYNVDEDDNTGSPARGGVYDHAQDHDNILHAMFHTTPFVKGVPQTVRIEYASRFSSRGIRWGFSTISGTQPSSDINKFFMISMNTNSSLKECVTVTGNEIFVGKIFADEICATGIDVTGNIILQGSAIAIGDHTTVNTLGSAITLEGVGNVSTTVEGQTIAISGSDNIVATTGSFSESLTLSGLPVLNSPFNLTVQEVDTTPTVTNVNKIIVTNSTLTDNMDGSVTIDTGGGGSSLTVREVDSNPSVSNVDTIVVSNGSLTDNTGGTVTINVLTTSGTVSGTGRWDPMTPPFTADGSDYDDEFDGSLDLGRWTKWNEGPVSLVGDIETRSYPDRVSLDFSGVQDPFVGLYQAFDGQSEDEVHLFTHVMLNNHSGFWDGDYRNDQWAGMALFENTAAPSTTNFLFFGIHQHSTGGIDDGPLWEIGVWDFTQYDDTSPTQVNDIQTSSGISLPGGVFFRLMWDKALKRMNPAWSSDGYGWNMFNFLELTPDASFDTFNGVGLVAARRDGLVGSVDFSFFRSLSDIQEFGVENPMPAGKLLSGNDAVIASTNPFRGALVRISDGNQTVDNAAEDPVTWQVSSDPGSYDTDGFLTASGNNFLQVPEDVTRVKLSGQVFWDGSTGSRLAVIRYPDTTPSQLGTAFVGAPHNEVDGTVANPSNNLETPVLTVSGGTQFWLAVKNNSDSGSDDILDNVQTYFGIEVIE